MGAKSALRWEGFGSFAAPKAAELADGRPASNDAGKGSQLHRPQPVGYLVVSMDAGFFQQKK